MEKAKKDVGQKFRRIKHNLVNSSKKDDDDDLKIVTALEHRNQKIISAVEKYKKNVSSTVKTGLREENVDKRRKKLDEFNLCVDLREGAGELEQSHTTCLHKVMYKIGQAVQVMVEEKVKHDMMVEKRVLDDLTQYQDMEKALIKSRERLNNAFTDVDIARKALDKSDGNSYQLQDNLDASKLKLENQKDNTITDIYSLAAKEQEIAKVFTALLEEQLEYHRVAMRTIEMVLPEIRRDIDNARPRPIFGVDLTEHLRHTQNRIAKVLEKCCTLLRASGFTEKGLFRVNGNNTKIRRMKAAFDTGQIDVDEQAYHLDPHSVCSVLKCYLRELPDPLLTHRLHNDWLNAARLENEDRLRAIEQCIGQLPPSHRDNLTYLIHFLVEMLQYQDVTAMNAGNLAIVFGPNLLGGDIDGNNTFGTKIVETLLKNASRLFGCPMNGDATNHTHNEMILSTKSLNIDTTSDSKVRLETRVSPSQWGISPRGSRPKERAPPPPLVSKVAKPLIDLSDDWLSPGVITDISSHLSNRNGTTQYNKEYSFCHTDANSNSHDQLNESCSIRRTPSADSDDSFNDYSNDYTSLNLTEKRTPLRPPPPMYRTNPEIVQNRPLSCNSAMVSEPTPAPRIKPVNSIYTDHSVVPLGIKKPTVVRDELVGISDVCNRTVVSIEAPPLPTRSKPPLPAKPKGDDKETSRL